MTISTLDSQQGNIQVYFLAAPEDQAVSEEIAKHLSPIVRNSARPIDVNSDFNIPAGADREIHKQRLFDADIVLALISVDFIDNEDIYTRNQRVIERYNNHETVMIPILVRNCMWKSTPFVNMPVLPKNLQPLNNKQFWNSQDDAVMAVVSDIYDSITELAQTQSEAVPPSSAAEVPTVLDPKTTPETPISQEEYIEQEQTYELVVKEGPNPGQVYALTEDVTVIGREPTADWQIDFEAVSRTHAKITRKEEEFEIEDLGSSNGTFINGKKLEATRILQPGDQVKLGQSVVLEFSLEPSPQTTVSSKQPEADTVREVPSELQDSITESSQSKSEAVPPSPAVEVQSAPDLKAASGTSKSQARESLPISVDWRKQYYQAVAIKRAGAIIIDQFVFQFLVFPFTSILLAFQIPIELVIWTSFIPYFVIIPIMESSKWQGTIGKRILKLQITNREGERITFLRALWRNILRTLMLYSYFLVVPLVIQYYRFNKTKKFFHDELSGTVIGDL